jgi:hypothetical protein
MHDKEGRVYPPFFVVQKCCGAATLSRESTFSSRFRLLPTLCLLIRAQSKDEHRSNNQEQMGQVSHA